jgi:hypothetical protein
MTEGLCCHTEAKCHACAAKTSDYFDSVLWMKTEIRFLRMFGIDTIPAFSHSKVRNPREAVEVLQN